MTQTTTAPTLPDDAKALLDAPEHAVIATIDPDGRPQLSVVWVARDGDDVLVSTVRGRRKAENLERDPRATVLVYARDEPHRYLEIRGDVTLVDDGPDSELIHRLVRAYTGAERYTGDDGTSNQRVVVRLTPRRVVWRV
ncbi:PPOX class F420-dependent oxidoreductase [Luteimicrobium sp. DT211]|uniref:PPOX class F420-dependent oxidoreductase n=1 Tax=Luteimicrobium sp. DT211 TaxID=3393412 RepID=UPI003CF9DED7